MTVLLLRAMRAAGSSQGTDAGASSQSGEHSALHGCTRVRGLPSLSQRPPAGQMTTLAQTAACTVAASLRYVALTTPASKFRTCKTVHGADLRRHVEVTLQSSAAELQLLVHSAPLVHQQPRSLTPHPPAAPAGMLLEAARAHYAVHAQRRARLWAGHLARIQADPGSVTDSGAEPARCARTQDLLSCARIAPRLAARQEVAAALVQLGFEQEQAHMPLLDASLTSIVQVRLLSSLPCGTVLPRADAATIPGTALQ